MVKHQLDRMRFLALVLVKTESNAQESPGPTLAFCLHTVVQRVYAQISQQIATLAP